MKPGKKARRPVERTARTIGEGLSLAWYAPRFKDSKLFRPGEAIAVPGRPGTVAAIGAICTDDTELFDAPIEFDARAVLSADRVIRKPDRAESTELVLAAPRRDPVRIGIRAPLGAVLHAIRRALPKAGG